MWVEGTDGPGSQERAPLMLCVQGTCGTTGHCPGDALGVLQHYCLRSDDSGVLSLSCTQGLNLISLEIYRKECYIFISHHTQKYIPSCLKI